MANPFGVLYNPLSIERLMENAASGKIYTEEDVFFDGELSHIHPYLEKTKKNAWKI